MPPAKRRKTRVREHIIADLSYHHIAGPILRAGFSIDEPKSDYGKDAHIETFDVDGCVENGYIFVQLKATDTIERYELKNGDLSFPFDVRDLDYWSNEQYPAYLVLYDARAEIAYWVWIQEYIAAKDIEVENIKTETYALHIPRTQIFDHATPAVWRAQKAGIIAKDGDDNV